MFDSINGIILAIFSLGFLIFIHELGHFLAAKRCGIRVDKFSIGFGPKLIGFKRGETEYCISVLPFGGYVKMPGENPEERTGAPGEFPSAPIGHRIFVAIAGPAMNVAFGVIVFSLIYMISGEYIRESLETTQVGRIVDGSPAEKAGLQPGDKLVAINGKPLKDWRDLQMAVAIKPDKELEIEIIRNGQKQTLHNVKTETRKIKARRIGQLGVSPKQAVLVSHVEDESWAAKSGLQPGDLIDTANGETIHTYLDFFDITRRNHGNEIPLEIRRGFISDIESIHQTDLNNGAISRQLRQAFKNHNTPLSKNAVISTMEAGNKWKITDVDKTYTLQKGKAKINIYKDEGGPLVKNLHLDWKLIVKALQKGSQVQVEGIQPGDQVIAINGESVQDVDFEKKVKELAKVQGDQSAEFEFLRSGEKFVATLRLKHEDTKLNFKQKLAALLKLRHSQNDEILLTEELFVEPTVSSLQLIEPFRVKRYNFITAWGRGTEESWSMIVQALSMVSQLLTGKISLELLSGPIGIVSATAETARFGFRELIYFAGFISVNLAFVNLLPIPIADGGLILFFSIEKLRGKPLSIRKQLIIQQVSIILIIGLFLYITWFDLLGL